MNLIQEAKNYIAHITEGYTLEVDLISRLVDRLGELEKDNQILRNCMKNAREAYIGMDGFKPETAPEGYCLWLLEQMYNELCDKPLPPVGTKE